VKPAPDELRVTFVAVGHGGCTVLETPDGRVLLYDAGAMGGSLCPVASMARAQCLPGARQHEQSIKRSRSPGPGPSLNEDRKAAMRVSRSLPTHRL